MMGPTSTELSAFNIGDRVELLLFYGFHSEAPPQGTVVGKSSKRVHCKMDDTGRVIRFDPSDLRVIESRGE
jgi:hypothetical protein